jgi:hypothetical protein
MAYIGKSPTGSGVRQRYYFTATGGETSLSGTDDNGLTLSYSDGAYVDVLLNGIELVAGTDYNTSTANTISGLSALAASDIVTVTVYDIFTVADTVSAKDGGTFSGNVGLAGNDLILDADADSKIEASTDDTINIISGGTTGLTIDSSGSVSMPNTVMYHMFRMTTNVTTNATVMTAWEEPDDTMDAHRVGNYSMTHSSGHWTFPRTGVYSVRFYALVDTVSTDDVTGVALFGSTDGGSTFTDRLVLATAGGFDSTTDRNSISGETMVNITNTSTHQVRLVTESVGSSSSVLGNTDDNRTYIIFQYLAPAQ